MVSRGNRLKNGWTSMPIASQCSTFRLSFFTSNFSFFLKLRLEKSAMIRSSPHLLEDREETFSLFILFRVTTFSHDLIPNYLRTRPDPEIEARYNTLETRANGASQVFFLLFAWLFLPFSTSLFYLQSFCTFKQNNKISKDLGIHWGFTKVIKIHAHCAKYKKIYKK